jgi:parallel beta-helix repeat protein
LFAPLGAGYASAATDYVNLGESIQAAVNGASAGDTIIVRDGTYHENIVGEDKSLTIRSVNAPDSTIVRKDGVGCIFDVNADYVNISGSTLKYATGVITIGASASPIALFYADNCNISNNLCSTSYDGISLQYSSNKISILNNTGCGNLYGMLLYNSPNSTISNNLCNNNRYGIRLNHSTNTSIDRNIYLSNVVGIGFWNQNKCNISNNFCSNNTFGIALFDRSNDNRIWNNSCFINNYGILLSDSNKCSIAKNNCSSNFRGIRFNNSIKNIIYFNNFMYNNYNVRSDSSTNIWKSPEQITYSYNGNTYRSYLGNYWDDYSGTDADADKIGDTHYGIDGNSDSYPLMEPWQNYVA